MKLLTKSAQSARALIVYRLTQFDFHMRNHDMRLTSQYFGQLYGLGTHKFREQQNTPAQIQKKKFKTEQNETRRNRRWRRP